MARSAARATSRSAARARARASKKTDEETDEGTCTQNIGEICTQSNGEICTQNIGERNGKANEKSEPEERRRDLPEWGETLASETRRTRGLVDSWDLRDQRTRGLKGYASGEEPTVGQDEFEGQDESDEASLMEQGKNGVWRTKQVW